MDVNQSVMTQISFLLKNRRVFSSQLSSIAAIQQLHRIIHVNEIVKFVFVILDVYWQEIYEEFKSKRVKCQIQKKN